MKASGRWLCRWGAALALALMLTSQAALAERVAVSALDGDRKGRLRAQVTAILRKTREVQVLPPTAWAKAAGKQGLRGPASVEPRVVARLAPKLKVDAVLTGSAGRTYSTFNARLIGRDGQELWAGEYPLAHGLLSKYQVRKFVLAVVEALKAANPPVPESPPPAPGQPEPVTGSVSSPPAPPVEQPASKSQGADEASHTDTAELAGSGGGFPEGEPAREEGALAGGRLPPRVKVSLGAAVTWRNYCARPAVTSCAEFDARPPEQQVGDIADFTSNVPYMGFAVEAEVFPLSHWPTVLRGVGLTLGYQRSFARTTVQVSSPVGETPEREVYATDTAYGAMLAYRVFFDLGRQGEPLWGHAGMRVGALGREFDVDEPADAPLPEVHRFYPAVGLEVSVPLMRAVRIEGAGQLFFRPNPGRSLGGDDEGSQVAEVRDYGTSVSSLGWAAELGVAGDLWGPIGYFARFRLDYYRDRFSGQGIRRGWTGSGVAEESYSSIIAGLTAAW
jgi:hypothetical protein